MSGSTFDFTEVDHSRQEKLVGYLDSMRAADQTAEMKRRSIDALQLFAGEAVLDVGCGTGEDVAAMAARVAPGGRAVGVDLSVAMIEQAWARHRGSGDVQFEVADAMALPFGDGEFSAVREERMLQHVPEPDKALTEIVRVTRPGGRVLALEPDWGTLAVDHPDANLTLRVLSIQTLATRHGTIGRQLRRRMLAAGLEDVEVSRWLFALEPIELFRKLVALDMHHESLGSSSPVTSAELETWWHGLTQVSDAGGFTACLAGYQVLGYRPESSAGRTTHARDQSRR